jgi:hypothetical protein
MMRLPQLVRFCIRFGDSVTPTACWPAANDDAFAA